MYKKVPNCLPDLHLASFNIFYRCYCDVPTHKIFHFQTVTGVLSNTDHQLVVSRYNIIFHIFLLTRVILCSLVFRESLKKIIINRKIVQRGLKILKLQEKNKMRLNVVNI